jgi:hypothetical protein
LDEVLLMLFAPHTPAISHADLESSRPVDSNPPSVRRVDWQGTVVVQSTEREDSFAIGPDGCVWNFVQQPGQAPQLLPTGLKANSFAVAQDEQGRLMVFAADGLRMQAAVQQLAAQHDASTHWNPQACSVWSPPMALQMPSVAHAVAITQVRCEGAGAALHVGAVLVCQRESQAEYFELVVSRWPHDGIQLRHVHSVHHAWAHSWYELLRELRRLAQVSSHQALGAM